MLSIDQVCSNSLSMCSRQAERRLRASAIVSHGKQHRKANNGGVSGEVSSSDPGGGVMSTLSVQGNIILIVLIAQLYKIYQCSSHACLIFS